MESPDDQPRPARQPRVPHSPTPESPGMVWRRTVDMHFHANLDCRADELRATAIKKPHLAAEFAKLASKHRVAYPAAWNADLFDGDGQ